jgi:Uma2 family endonuclease
LLMAPAPDTWHQDWSRKLFRLIDRFLSQHALGELYYAPIDVVLDAENTVQPDLVFVARPNATIVQRRAIFGTPDLVIELVSLASVRRDRYDKRALYARFGVRDYWIADPANQSLEVLTLKEGCYELHCAAEVQGELTSRVLPGLTFDVKHLQ